MKTLVRLRKVTRRLAKRLSAPSGKGAPNRASRRPALSADGTTNAAWAELTDRTLEEIEAVDEIYRPTNFWEPARDQLLADMAKLGLENFKSWPTSWIWFCPRYNRGFSNATINVVYRRAKEVNPSINKAVMTGLLNGVREARRDLDVVRLAWDQQRWPFDLTGYGESLVGTPPEYYKLTGADHGWTRPYLNYLLCLSALSRHVRAVPKAFLEIGGGYGVLGEILLSRDPEAKYVNLDIPPLLTVSSYYLRTLFGDRVATYDGDLRKPGDLKLETSAVLPNWRVKDIRGHFDVFANAFSFQEMEPKVVANYVDAVAELGVEYVVSLNSRAGKPTAEQRGDAPWGGVIEQVTSQMIVDLFAARGYDLEGRYDAPLINVADSAAELVVLSKRSSAIA